MTMRISECRQNVAGLILAAGASTRMGKLKQLLPVGRRTLLGCILNETLKSDLNKVILVLGHRFNEIQAALGQILQHPKLKIVENSHYKEGISSSIIAGLFEIEKDHDHVMVILGDMPNISSSLINLLLDKYLKSNLPIGAIKIRTKQSHPVIFCRKMYYELHKLYGDIGARNLFIKYSDQVCLVEPDNFYDNTDIDTPEDYVKFSR